MAVPLRVACALVFLGACSAQTLNPQGRGATDGIHDPSRILELNGTYFAFSSSMHDDVGMPLLTSTSPSLYNSVWDVDFNVGVTNFRPAWIDEMWPDWMGAYWAPDIIKMGDLYYLYYSVHRNINGYEKEACCGFATSENPLDMNGWTDYGRPLVCSFDRDDPNDFHAIDPAMIIVDNELWMSFAGQGDDGGVYMLKLDINTGGLIPGTDYDPLRPVPGNPDDLIQVVRGAPFGLLEAPFIEEREGWFYMYYNRGACCRGCESTYEIRMARSRSVTGPYLDKQERDVIDESAGSMFYAHQGGPTGKWIGPGHFSSYQLDDDTTLFNIHYYNGDARECRSGMEIRTLHYDDDAWPFQYD